MAPPPTTHAGGGSRPWGLRAALVLSTLAFAPEWVVAPLDAVSVQARVLAVAVVLVWIVLVVAALIAVGDLPPTANGEAPNRAAVGRELGEGAARVVRRVEFGERVLFLAVIGSALGALAARIPGIGIDAAWAGAVIVIAAAALTAFGSRAIPDGMWAAPSYLLLALLALLLVTGTLNFVQLRVVMIAPAPATAEAAWESLGTTEALRAFALGAALLLGISMVARGGNRKGARTLVGIHALLFFLLVVLFVAYGVEVGGAGLALAEAARSVFGPGTPAAAAFVGALAWLLAAALYVTLERLSHDSEGRRWAGPLGAVAVASVGIVIFGGDLGTLAPLWAAALLVGPLVFFIARLAARLRDLARPHERRAASGWRGIAHGVAAVGGVVALAGALLLLTGCMRPVPEKRLDQLVLPEGFRIDVFVDGIDQARQMALGDDGTLYVGTKTLGKVYAVPDRDGDSRGDEVIVLATGLQQSNGVDFLEGDLYVAEGHRIIRYRGISERLLDPPEPELVTDGIPTRDYHQQIYIRFGPGGLLHAAVGAPCNVCLAEHPLFASLVRVEPSGRVERIAEGIRNSVGFDWHPDTGEMWFTENARDWMGDEIPPDELNRLARPGLHFGFPHCHASIRDPKFGQEVDCSRFEPPELEFPAHVAVLGMKFYDGSGFPPEYRNRIFVAEHGSYNRSERVGYRITMISIDDAGGEGGGAEYRTFLEGWLEEDGTVWGRPVDLLVMPDGSLLVSDDLGNAIYRITWAGP